MIPTGVLLLMVCAAAFSLSCGDSGKAGMPDMTYFYDLNTGVIFRAPRDSITPIDAPSGSDSAGQPTGVRVRIFSCGACEVDFEGMTPAQVAEAGAFVGYLERHPDGFKQLVGGSPNPTEARVVRMGMLIRPIDGDQWIEENSPQGQRIQFDLRKRCPSATLVECLGEP